MIILNSAYSQPLHQMEIVQHHVPAALPLAKRSRYQLGRRVCGPQSLSEHHFYTCQEELQCCCQGAASLCHDSLQVRMRAASRTNQIVFGCSPPTNTLTITVETASLEIVVKYMQSMCILIDPVVVRRPIVALCVLRTVPCIS